MTTRFWHCSSAVLQAPRNSVVSFPNMEEFEGLPEVIFELFGIN
jgi:hypothetical protein